MAMNLGMKTPKLWFVTNMTAGDFNPTNAENDSFNTNGTWNTSTGGATAPREEQYLDLGIVLDEREELTMGGIPISLPGTGVDNRLFWAVGGKVLRVTVSGIIPDGYYVSSNATDNTIYSGKSCSSVFKYKMCRILAYQNFATGGEGFIGNIANMHAVRYRRSMVYEKTPGSDAEEIAQWIITSYSFNYIQGTRNLQYTISLDLSNNSGLPSNMRPRSFGETL